MLMNYATAGLILLANPNARIINTLRHPLDNALSAYTTIFQTADSFPEANDPGTFAHHYVNYRRLTTFWKTTLPEGTFIDIHYEDVVQDFEASARRILGFCGLGWEPRVLHFYEGKRMIHTASMHAVRKPIYNFSVGKWKKVVLAPWIDILLDELVPEYVSVSDRTLAKARKQRAVSYPIL